jgi:hypothetical protein
MGIRLRESPSGEVLEGGAAAPGFIWALVWNPTNDDWEAVLIQDPATAGAPLSNTFFVDKGTAVAVPDQDGSINRPFATIGAALTAVAALAGSVGTILVNATTNDGDYSAEGPLVITPGTVAIAPIGNGYFRGTYDAAAQGPILVDSVTVPGGAFHVVELFGVTAIGVGTITFAEDGFLYLGLASQFGAVVCTAPTAGLFVGASDCAVTSFAGLADLSTFNNVYFTASAGKVLTSLGTVINFMNCTFTPNVLEIEFLGAAGVVNMDAVTNFFWKAATETLTNGAKVIIGDLLP